MLVRIKEEKKKLTFQVSPRVNRVLGTVFLEFDMRTQDPQEHATMGAMYHAKKSRHVPYLGRFRLFLMARFF